MKFIPLTQGHFAMVDDEDFERVSQFNWFAHNRGYAARNLPRDGGRQFTQYLHVFLKCPVGGEEIHHENGNGFDNQKHNLKRTTHAGNMHGFRKQHSNNRSGYRGVTVRKSEFKKFRAEIGCSGKTTHIGYFFCAKEAARARDAKARELGRPEDGMNFPL